ncbi:MAG TPA: hypothetical protein VFU74_09020 [Actinocrinis sp.]|nr:hypothetical protein [Actinocrinis sp.]
MKTRIRAALASAAVVAAVGAATFTGGTAAHAAAIADNWYGCDPGWVCIYAQGVAWEDLSASNLNEAYYSYGAHNLHNEYGGHWVINNQTDTDTGWAEAKLCTGYGGGGACGVDTGQLEAILSAGTGRFVSNMSPLNSIVLYLSPK